MLDETQESQIQKTVGRWDTVFDFAVLAVL